MLLVELLLEAKIVKDYRHGDKFKELPYWPAKEDPKFIDPSKGFYFTFSKGELILHSTDNFSYDGVIALGLIDQMLKSNGKGMPREIQLAIKGAGTDMWNKFSGIVDLDSKIITISKEYDFMSKLRQRALNDVKDIQLAFKNLKRYGVTDDFKLKGVPAPFNGMKVAEFLQQADPVHDLHKHGGQIFYHGTSKKRYDDFILKQGLRPGKTGEVYSDLIKGYSEHNVYLASNAKTAEFYGKRQAEKDDDTQYVVLKITLPDAAKLMPDDFFARHMKPGQEHDRIKTGLRDLGSVAYKGIILPKFIQVVSTKKA